MSDPGGGTDQLVTARLALRPLRESDLDALAAIYADPAVMRFLGGPRTREETRTGLGWIIAAHREQGFGRRGRYRARDRLPAGLGVVGEGLCD